MRFGHRFLSYALRGVTRSIFASEQKPYVLGRVAPDAHYSIRENLRVLHPDTSAARVECSLVWDDELMLSGVISLQIAIRTTS
jgi:hypothetical protein